MFILSFIINGLVLGILLTLIAQQEDVITNFMPPVAIVILSGLASTILSLMIPGMIGAILSLVAYIMVFYILLGKMYMLTDLVRKKIVSIFIGIQICWTVLMMILASANS